MNRRIIVWGLIGLAVGCVCAIIALLAGPNFNLGRSALVAIIDPVALLGRRMPLGVASSIFLNGCLYALVGLVVGLIRKPATSLLTRKVR